MRVIAALAALTLLASCSLIGSGADSCGDESAKGALQSLIHKTVQNAAARALRTNEVRSFTTSEIRRAVERISLTLDDVRTSKSGTSSAQQCRATASLRFPAEMVETVDRFRAAKNESSTTDWAKDFDIERGSRGFGADLEYSVQPTDDKSKVFAEADTSQGLLDFAAQMVATALQAPQAMQAINAEARAQAETELAEAQAAKETEVATQQAEVARVEEARTANTLARQAINALWASATPAEWGALVPLQRAWVKRKTADCNLEAASASTDPDLKALAFLQCDTRLTVERISFLRQNGPVSASE